MSISGKMVATRRPGVWSRLLRIAVPAVLVTLCAGLAHAQVTTTGNIRVAVADQDGLAVPGATVTAAADDAATTRVAVTDIRGEAELGALSPSARYVVTVELPGFQTSRQEDFLVRAGQTASTRVTLTVGSVTETVVVTAASPVVDVTSAVVAEDITLDLTEAVPTGRTYQSYLQLVPGVLPDDPESPGNPASKSGLNYSDIGGSTSVSRDNFYYIDGINVTDGVSGTFGANLNTEIIQEQQVLTGGIPAEFVGAPGLVSSVITKSGTNQFSGSVNYFFQNDGLVAENRNATDLEFSRFDAAVTGGGPIVANEAWFFGSYRRLERRDTVVALDGVDVIRRVENQQDQFYARGTWAPTTTDTLSFTFLNDPTEISGRRDRDVTNARDRRRVQGGNNYHLKYNRLFGGVLVEGSYSKHNGEVSDFAVVPGARNTIVFRDSDVRTLEDEQLGGFGFDDIDQRDTTGLKGTAVVQLGRHSIHGGIEFMRNANFRDTVYDGGDYASLSPALAGLTAADLIAGSFTVTYFDPTNSSDYSGFIRAVDNRPDRAEFYALYDGDADGVITQDELAANLVFDSIAGNPHGAVNYDRLVQTALGSQQTRSDGLSLFVQDTFSVSDKLSFNLGLRAERFEHFATDDSSVFTFDWTFAPRLSVSYDPSGRGQQRISAFYGRYFDPIRNNLTNFAGTVSGSTREEQVYANDQWVTYRIRGGPQQADALFAPTTRTPWTDDFQLSYETDLGEGRSFMALYTHRRTRDIIEDYELALYAFRDDGTTNYPGPVGHADSLFLGLDYFGYDTFPESNFVIATLAGGQRDYQGIEFTFRQRLRDNWQALAAYTYGDARGNTNSDSNADFQGDVIWLDPRAPHQLGVQPGSIAHLFKLSSSYTWDRGFQVGANWRWNSGTVASRTFHASSRNLPARVEEGDEFEFAGITRRWLAPDSVGALRNPAYGSVDIRLLYNYRLAGYRLELFADVFNLFNNQDAIRNQDLLAGSGSINFGDGILFTPPRRMFLGVRLNF